MCQKLLIPEQADNKQMQQLAAEAYQNIQRYADHALAVIRMLTLAKWNPKQEIEAPLQQLLHQVANGWTLGKRGHDANGARHLPRTPGGPNALEPKAHRAQHPLHRLHLPTTRPRTPARHTTLLEPATPLWA